MVAKNIDDFLSFNIFSQKCVNSDVIPGQYAQIKLTASSLLLYVFLKKKVQS
jgi:hypothetical protein